MIHEVNLEFRYILPAALPAQEFLPGIGQILYGNDILVGMSKLRSHSLESTPPRLVPVLIEIKTVYIAWNASAAKFPKTVKYSLGLKIDNLLIDTIEAISIATFLQPSEKLPYLKRALTRIGTLKVFLQIVWEMDLIDTKYYTDLSEKVSGVGKMLGGWYGQVARQNSPAPGGAGKK
jgi:hypothetical protein